MRFRRLELSNWRNFKSVDVELAPRVFLVGPNAIGKSNLLSAFRFLRNIVADVGGGLAAAVHHEGGVKAIRSAHARQSDITITVHVGNDDGDEWRYMLRFSEARKGSLAPMIKGECIERLGAAPAEWKSDPHRPSSQTVIEQTLHADFIQPFVDFLRSISYLHVVPQLVRESLPPRADALGPDPFGRDLLARIWKTPERQRKSRLAAIQSELRSVVPQFETLEIELAGEKPHLKVGFKSWRSPLVHQTDRQFSDGTLRLIGLLWSLQEPRGPLLLEEPELSLHTEIVRRLAGAISRAQRRGRGRQVLISTHSETLLSDPGIGPEEVLLVLAGREGSEVLLGASDARIREAMLHGLTAAEAALPRAAPDPRQLVLFGQDS